MIDKKGEITMHKQLEIISKLENELTRVTALEQKLAEDLASLPEGFLMKRHDGRVFHVIKSNGEKEINQLNNKDAHDIQLFSELKYKRYIKAALPVLRDWIKNIESFLQKVTVYNPLEIQDNLKSQYHGLEGLPIFLAGDINPESWGKQKSPPMYEDGLIHPSQKGLMTRSKSEAQIASAYETQKWKFIYEPVIKLADGRILRPDFAVLHPKKRKVIYHEHLGMMDDPEYAMKAIKKLNDYASVGIVLGDNLVVTAESKVQPLTFQDIDELIRKIESM